jgi:Transposase DDE domain
VVLADAGYWKNEAIEALVGQGIQPLVAPDADRRKEPRPGRRGGLYDFARRVLATDFGKELYLNRQGSVEPVFGQIKANRGANRFSRRGRTAVRSEWRLLAATPQPAQAPQACATPSARSDSAGRSARAAVRARR